MGAVESAHNTCGAGDVMLQDVKNKTCLSDSVLSRRSLQHSTAESNKNRRRALPAAGPFRPRADVKLSMFVAEISKKPSLSSRSSPRDRMSKPSGTLVNLSRRQAERDRRVVPYCKEDSSLRRLASLACRPTTCIFLMASTRASFPGKSSAAWSSWAWSSSAYLRRRCVGLLR